MVSSCVVNAGYSRCEYDSAGDSGIVILQAQRVSTNRRGNSFFINSDIK